MELTFEQKTDIGFQYVLDLLEPCSCFGAARLRGISAFTSSAELEKEYDNIEKTINAFDSCGSVIKKIDVSLMQTKDITKIVEKCRETSLTDVELFEIKRFLLICRDIYPLFQNLNGKTAFEDIAFCDLAEALSIVDPDNTGVASFYVSDTTSKALADIRKSKKNIENAIRLETDPALKEQLLLDRTVIAAKEEEAEMAVKRRMSRDLVPFLDRFSENIDNMAKLDLVFRKAELARSHKTCRPNISEGILSFDGMTNPKITDILSESGKDFTPVSIEVKRGATVITGANMGGKSVAIKTLALNTLLALCGIFPFADRAVISMLDSIYIIADDMESIDEGLSSFGGEIIKFNSLAERLGEKTLALLDEFARGTNPDEGAAIVRAVTKWLNGKDSISVLTTHYDGVAELADAHYQVIGLKDLDFDRIKAEIDAVSKDRGAARIAEHMNFGLYKVLDRQDCPRDALSICKLLDMNKNIIELAEKYY